MAVAALDPKFKEYAVLLCDQSQEALRVANLAEPVHCFRLAAQAAELGLDQDAVELFARFVLGIRGAEDDERPAIEIVRSASEQEKAGLENAHVLDAAVRRMMAMTDELARLSSPADVECEASSAEAQDVYEATRRLCEEALAHGLRG